jgi:hypothetical protein
MKRVNISSSTITIEMSSISVPYKGSMVSMIIFLFSPNKDNKELHDIKVMNLG